MTGRDLVTATLRLLGVVASGDSLAASEATDGLASLNRMLGGWSTEGLLIFARTREAVAMTAGTAAYTMGTGGTYGSTRALKIEEALIRDETVTPAIEYPVKILSLAEWSSIAQKDDTGALPHSLYHDGGFPLETVTVYPKPSVAHKLVLYSVKPLSEITTLDTSVSLPPGYDRALIYNLAVDLAPEYGKALPDAVVMVANESKAGLKRMNYRPNYLRVDDPLLPQGGGAFNINTGGY